MPLDRAVEFVAVDEIQLCADPDRGHVFTERLLHARGMVETMFLGAETIRPLLQHLVPQAEIETRPRLSQLTYAGPAKLMRLPPRSAVVAFSAGEVYAIAELIRRRRGGCAVVMGRLSPRTRNAQVKLYQDKEVDFLVATDAIGMGLNMDVDHVAFARLSKFDGRRPRRLFRVGGGADRRAGRARHARRHLRHHRHLPPAGRRLSSARWSSTTSSRWSSSPGATTSWTCPASTPCSTACSARRRAPAWSAGRMRRTSRPSPRCRVRRRSASSRAGGAWFACCGRSAASRTSASWRTTRTPGSAPGCSPTWRGRAGCPRTGSTPGSPAWPGRRATSTP